MIAVVTPIYRDRSNHMVFYLNYACEGSKYKFYRLESLKVTGFGKALCRLKKPFLAASLM
jgi:hypothetical protein